MGKKRGLNPWEEDISLSVDATSRSRYCDTRVMVPVAGCTAKSPGDLGVCSKMLYRRRVCIVSGSSLSVAQTTPTVVPDVKKEAFQSPALLSKLSEF